MTKGKRKRRRPAHGSTPASAEAVLEEIDRRIADLAQYDPPQAGPIWGATHKLLLKTPADAAEVARIVTTRDVEALARLVGVLRGLDTPPEPAEPDADDGGAEPSAMADVAPETMKKALRAFRKRLKLTRLDHESRLGVGPMTSGRRADFDAILPPREFPEEVWQALVAAGELRSAGQGFYMLGEDDAGD